MPPDDTVRAAEPEAPPAATASTPVQVSLSFGANGPAVRFHALIDALPSIALAIGFWMLIIHAVPKDNHDLVSNALAGLLGFVTRGIVQRATTATGQGAGQ